jgi:2-keto-4-pentenoate hydratase
MMERSEIENLARELFSAYQSGQMVSTPVSSRAGFDLDSAYEIEATIRHMREASGARVAGRKVGFANKAMWRVFKLQTLVWGHMYDDTVHYATGNSATLTLPQARSLKVEPEIVFGLKKAITAEGADARAALESTDWLALGFEIIDCPFPNWKFQPGDFVAAMGLHAALVVGKPMPVRADAIDMLLEQLPKIKVRVGKNGELLEEGSGKNSLGNPAQCLAELGTAILRRTPKEPLAAGELVSSGTLTAGHLADGDNTWTVEVTGLPLETLTLHLRPMT